MTTKTAERGLGKSGLFNRTSALPAVRISERGAARLKNGHVWVYRSDVNAAERIGPGALVSVVDPKGRALGTALYSSASQIGLRLVSRDLIEDFAALLRERIAAAILYRERLVRDSNAYRIVFS